MNDEVRNPHVKLWASLLQDEAYALKTHKIQIIKNIYKTYIEYIPPPSSSSLPFFYNLGEQYRKKPRSAIQTTNTKMLRLRI